MKKFKILMLLGLVLLFAATLMGCEASEKAFEEVSNGSAGLIYRLSDDGSSYILSDCSPNADAEVIIPSTYKNKPVTGIDDNVFANMWKYDCNIISVIIPDSVTSIGSGAFSQCFRLESVTIGNGVTSIGAFAFSTCNSLVSITIPDSVISIGDKAFHGCDQLKSITIGDGVTSIGIGAFGNCPMLTRVTLGKSVTSIGESAFANCNNLTEITIPNSITQISTVAFQYCNMLRDIYYTGTEAEWNAIEIDNIWIQNATIHFNSKN